MFYFEHTAATPTSTAKLLQDPDLFKFKTQSSQLADVQGDKLVVKIVEQILKL